MPTGNNRGATHGNGAIKGVHGHLKGRIALQFPLVHRGGRHQLRQRHAGLPVRGDAAGHQGLSLQQRRDSQPLHRAHRVPPPLPEGTDPGTQGWGQGRTAIHGQNFPGT